MKCYKRLIYKQCPSQVFVAQFLGYFPKRFTYLCRALYCRTPYWCTVLVDQYGRRKTTKTSGVHFSLDCKTVRIFAYSSTREQSNKKSGMRLKTESETGERRFFSLASHAIRACEARALGARKTLTPRFTDFFTDFEKKKPTVLQSNFSYKSSFFSLENSHMCA